MTAAGQGSSTSYRYDDEGNRTQAKDRVTGAATAYTWNTDYQLTGVTSPDGTEVVYGYDPLGRRISATDGSGTEYFVWAGANLRAVIDDAGGVRARLVGDPQRLSDTLAITTAGGTVFALVDGLGSATTVTDQAGEVVSRTGYTAYGTPVVLEGADPTGGLVGFTGYQQDPTGLDYARARYYDPATNSFLSEDPVVAVNPYTYVSGDPINKIDPTGQIVFTSEGELTTVARSVLFGAMLGGIEGGVSGAMSGVLSCDGDLDCIGHYVVANAGMGALLGDVFGGGVGGALAWSPLRSCVVGAGMGFVQGYLLGKYVLPGNDPAWGWAGGISGATDATAGCISGGLSPSP